MKSAFCKHLASVSNCMTYIPAVTVFEMNTNSQKCFVFLHSTGDGHLDPIVKVQNNQLGGDTTWSDNTRSFFTQMYYFAVSMDSQKCKA